MLVSPHLCPCQPVRRPLCGIIWLPLDYQAFLWEAVINFAFPFTVLRQNLLPDNPVAHRFLLVVLCPLVTLDSAAISTIDISADDPASSCPCLEGVPAYVLCVFLLPAASGSFLPFHHLLALRAARQLPSPSTQQLQFSVAASKCRTTSWLQLTNIPRSLRLAVWPEVEGEEFLVPVVQLVTQTAARGLSLQPSRVWVSDTAPA